MKEVRFGKNVYKIENLYKGLSLDKSGNYVVQRMNSTSSRVGISMDAMVKIAASFDSSAMNVKNKLMIYKNVNKLIGEEKDDVKKFAFMKAIQTIMDEKELEQNAEKSTDRTVFYGGRIQ